MALIFDENFVDPAPFKEEILKVTITEDLCAQDERPVKEEVIESFVTQVKTEAFWILHKGFGAGTYYTGRNDDSDPASQEAL